MRKNGIGVILFIVAALLVVGGYIKTNNENLGNSSFANPDDSYIADNSINYGNVVLDNDNNTNVEKITFTNKENHSVNINSSDITISCIGSGSNKYEDEALVEKNMRVKASFSFTENGTKYDSLTVGAKDKAYVYVSSSYVGDTYPSNEVTCNYSLNIQAM